jgi:hypothetical protein
VFQKCQQDIAYRLTLRKEGKFTGLGIDNFAAEEPGPERPLCRYELSVVEADSEP